MSSVADKSTDEKRDFLIEISQRILRARLAGDILPLAEGLAEAVLELNADLVEGKPLPMRWARARQNIYVIKHGDTLAVTKVFVSDLRAKTLAV